MKFDRTIDIEGRQISASHPCFIIAEAGVNHGGDIELAKKLIDIAVDAGADAVKFQAFRTSELIIENVEKAPYQTQTTSKSESQTEMLRKLELQKEQYTILRDYCQLHNIILIITPFDEQSLNELEECGMTSYKVASTDTTNLPFLKKIAQCGKPIFLSTGMTYLNEIKAALEEIHPYNKQVILMQCTANYPIKDEEANLNVLTTFKKEFDILLGYSDHSIGTGAAPYAVPMGACMIEKHFTLDKNAEGPDHKASLNPKELKDLVEEVRRIEKYLGGFEKKPTDSERLTRSSLQKCLVSKRTIAKGEEFSLDNVSAKRTGGKGISPIHYKKLIGKKASRDYALNEIIDIDL